MVMKESGRKVSYYVQAMQLFLQKVEKIQRLVTEARKSFSSWVWSYRVGEGTML